jgi:hypothetical protein
MAYLLLKRSRFLIRLIFLEFYLYPESNQQIKCADEKRENNLVSLAVLGL